MNTTPKKLSKGEESFDFLLKLHDFTPPVREYQFAPPRKWRFDFAWPQYLFAVEIEGLTYSGGRHQTLSGFVKDCEKYEAAMLRGWTVYRIPSQWLVKGNRRFIRRETIALLNNHLK